MAKGAIIKLGGFGGRVDRQKIVDVLIVLVSAVGRQAWTCRHRYSQKYKNQQPHRSLSAHKAPP
jgi:hypothetical protein